MSYSSGQTGQTYCCHENDRVLGGAQINTETIPSKALREAVLQLTGGNHSGYFGQLGSTKKEVTTADLVIFSQRVIRNEWEVIRNQFSAMISN